MSHDTEDSCKIRRKTDLLFQKWPEFGEFWPEHSKLSKFSLWLVLLWKVTFDLKKYRGVIFHGTEELRKIWRGIVLSFQSWHEEFDEFSPGHSKVSKTCPLMGSFWTSVWVKKIQRSYVWWHWRLIQNLKENWLVFSRMTWGTWQIFTGWKIAISF